MHLAEIVCVICWRCTLFPHDLFEAGFNGTFQFTVLAVIGEKRNASSSSTQETEDRTSECATCTLIEFVPALSNIQLRILRQLDIDGPADRMSIHEGNGRLFSDRYGARS